MRWDALARLRERFPLLCGPAVLESCALQGSACTGIHLLDTGRITPKATQRELAREWLDCQLPRFLSCVLRVQASVSGQAQRVAMDSSVSMKAIVEKLVLKHQSDSNSAATLSRPPPIEGQDLEALIRHWHVVGPIFG